MQSIFFMKMVDTDLMNKYQKKKNRSSIFLPILPIFVFKNGDFTYTGTFYSLIRSRMIFLRALLLKKTFQDKHFFTYATYLYYKLSYFALWKSAKTKLKIGKMGKNLDFSRWPFFYICSLGLYLPFSGKKSAAFFTEKKSWISTLWPELVQSQNRVTLWQIY